MTKLDYEKKLEVISNKEAVMFNKYESGQIDEYELLIFNSQMKKQRNVIKKNWATISSYTNGV